MCATRWRWRSRSASSACRSGRSPRRRVCRCRSRWRCRCWSSRAGRSSSRLPWSPQAGARSRPSRAGCCSTCGTCRSGWRSRTSSATAGPPVYWARTSSSTKWWRSPGLGKRRPRSSRLLDERHPARHVLEHGHAPGGRGGLGGPRSRGVRRRRGVSGCPARAPAPGPATARRSTGRPHLGADRGRGDAVPRTRPARARRSARPWRRGTEAGIVTAPTNTTAPVPASPPAEEHWS